MDTPSHFFSDCLDIDDSEPFPFDRLDKEGGDRQGVFTGYRDPLGEADSPLLPDSDLNAAKQGLWDGPAELMQKPLFIDPDLCNQDDLIAAREEATVSWATSDTRPSSRSGARSKSSSSQMASDSTSTSTDPPVEPIPPKRRRTRKTIKRESATTEDEEKRNQFLERNRIAASKCRQRKKEYVAELEGTKNELEDQNSHLQFEHSSLLEEVSSLKNHLMAHASCHDPNIDKWITMEARRFVENAADRKRSQQQGFGQPVQSRIPSSATSYRGVPLDALSRSARRSSTAYSHGGQELLSRLETVPLIHAPICRSHVSTAIPDRGGRTRFTSSET
jgi:cyclic AMP-dependent transcription factor ATF-2